MSDIQVNRQTTDGVTTFTITRGNDTFTVKDENGNGRIDKGDIWTTSGATLSKEELWEASGLSLKKEEMTTEELAEYAKFEEQRKALEEARAKQSQYQQYQQQLYIQQQPKKKNFWQKLGNGLMAAMPFIATAGAGVLGFFSNSWAFNRGNANDFSGQLLSGLSSGLMMGSTVMSGVFAVKAMKQMNNMQFSSYSYAPVQNQNVNVDAMLNSFIGDMNARQNTYLDQYQTYQEQQVQAQRSATAEAMFNDAQENPEKYNELNAKKLDAIYQPTKETYTEEEEKALALISKYPQVPADAIKKNANDTGKLDEKTAAKINAIIQRRNTAKAEAKIGEEAKAQNAVCTDENYKKLQAILTKAVTGQIINEDIEKLNNILKNPGAEPESEPETEE